MCQPNDSRSMNLCTKFTITCNQAPTDRIFSVKRGFISVLFPYGNYVAWTPVAIINPITEFSLTKEPEWKIFQSHDFHSPQKYVSCACHLFFHKQFQHIKSKSFFLLQFFVWINLMLLWFLFSNLKYTNQGLFVLLANKQWLKFKITCFWFFLFFISFKFAFTF